MRKSLSRAAIAAVAGFIVSAAPAGVWAQAPAPAASTPALAASDPVVAVVDGQKILMSDVSTAAESLPPQYRQYPLQTLFPALLDQLINGKLLVVEARKAKIETSPEYKKRLAVLEERLAQDAYLQAELEKRITPDMIKARYEQKTKDLPPVEEIKARHILIAPESEAEAKKIVEELKKKDADFQKIAREKSIDKSSGANGGDLGWFRKGDMVKEFGEAAFALKKGETTQQAVKSQFGWHIIRLEDRRTAPPPPMAQMEEEIRGELAREAYTQMLDGLRKTAKVERFNMDGSPIQPPPAPAPAATPAAPPQMAPSPAGKK